MNLVHSFTSKESGVGEYILSLKSLLKASEFEKCTDHSASRRVFVPFLKRVRDREDSRMITIKKVGLAFYLLLHLD